MVDASAAISWQTVSERGSPRFSCVFLGCSGKDYQVATSYLDAAHVRLHRAGSLEEADLLLAHGGARVLLTETTFPGGSWQDAVALKTTRHPGAVLVVTAESADEGLWLDVLEQGAYDLILKPFVADELLRVLANADACARMRAAVRKVRPSGLGW